jgi:hypothetical protein
VRSFTGRDAQLAALRDQLQSQQRAALVPAAALYGMGGIGKTQLARAYAHRYRDHYQLGWWAPAETPLTASTALAELAVRLGAPAELPQPQQLSYAREALAERDRWLLVCDNATDPAALEPLLPAAGKGHVLVTSRSAAWHGLAEPIPVELLPPDVAAELLRQRSGDRDQHAAQALAEELGRLPLALDQAAAYASRQRLSLAGYLEMFRARRAALLARGQPLAYQGTVDAAYTLALDQLRHADPAAAQLLALCALLAPDEIPVGWLLDEPDLLPGPLADAARDPLRRREVLGALYQAALLTPDVGDTARLHRLVQAVAVHHLPDQARRELVACAVELLAAVFPDEPEEPVSWPVCARLLPHAYALADHAHQQQLAAPALAELLTAMSDYVWARALGMTRARELSEQALAVYQRLHRGDHPDVANSLRDLARVQFELGEYVHARQLREQALAMLQRLHGGDHPDIAWALHGLAYDLRALGEPARAYRLDEQAVAMYQRLYPGDHPRLAASLTSVATGLRRLGEPARARDLDEQALAMYQRLYPGDHQGVAHALASFAVDLYALGEQARGRQLHEQAFAMGRRVFGGDNHHIGDALNLLGEDLRALGDFDYARELHEQAVAVFQRLYEGDHPRIASALHNLAEDLRGQGDYPRARQLHEQALAMRHRLHPGDQPDTATSLNDLAMTMRELGEHVRARQLHEQALTMRHRLHEGDHPATATTLDALADDLRAQGEDARARSLEEQALAMRQRLSERDQLQP